ncbi:MAG: universal stress protein [Thermodesulfobacteriota bacterium]
MFVDILLAVTPSEICQWAAEVAFAFARRHEARLHILHVCGPPEYSWSDVPFLHNTGEMDKAKAAIEERFRGHLSDLKNYSIEVVAGQPEMEILRAARKKNTDLIIMGPNEKAVRAGRLSTWGQTGSVLERVGQRAQCPIMIVPRAVPPERLSFANIVMATDFSEQADCALAYAGQLAKFYKAHLHVLHVVDVGSQFERLKVSQEEVEELIGDAFLRMDKGFAPTLKGVDHTFEVWEGVPYVEILKLARRRNGDLVLMAHHTKAQDPEKAYLGSTVAQVALRSACPTISINRHFDLRCETYVLKER